MELDYKQIGMNIARRRKELHLKQVEVLLSSAEAPGEMRGICTGNRATQCAEMHIRHPYRKERLADLLTHGYFSGHSNRSSA